MTPAAVVTTHHAAGARSIESNANVAGAFRFSGGARCRALGGVAVLTQEQKSMIEVIEFRILAIGVTRQ